MNPLIAAIIDENYVDAQTILDDGLDPNGGNYLILAIEERSRKGRKGNVDSLFKIIQALLAAGASTAEGNPLNLSLKFCDRAVAKLLIKLSSSPLPRISWETMFKECDYDFVLSLSKVGINIDDIDEKGSSGRLILFSSTNPFIINMAIENISNVNETNSNGDTPLLIAVSGGSLHSVDRLLELGADPNIKNNIGMTPLMAAAINSDLSIMKRLILSGADPKIRDGNGASLIHFAYTEKTCAYIASIIDNIQSVDNEGKSPIHYQYLVGMEAIVCLQEAGVDIDARDNKGNTALHYAAMSGNPKAVANLKISGADIGIRNNEGKLAIDLASSKAGKKHSDVIAIILR